MTGTKLPIFIGKETLKKIIIFHKDFPNLNEIAQTEAIIYLDCTDEELDVILEDSEDIISQFARSDVSIIAANDFFKLLEQDKTILSKNPHAMFILTITNEEAAVLSEKYGVIIQNEENINDNILQLNLYKRFERGDKIEGNMDGWQDIFKNVVLPPFNSMIITDEYLLKNSERGRNIGFENLKMLLNAILPQNLKIAFHLLIITPLGNISRERTSQFYEEIKTYLGSIRNYEFKIEFVFRDSLHARKAYTNYFVITCDKGFKMFKPNDPSVAYEEINDIRLQSVLHDPINTYGDSVLKMEILDLLKIKKLCDELTIQLQNGITNQPKLILGDANSNNTVINRLLNKTLN